MICNPLSIRVLKYFNSVSFPLIKNAGVKYLILRSASWIYLEWDFWNQKTSSWVKKFWYSFSNSFTVLWRWIELLNLNRFSIHLNRWRMLCFRKEMFTNTGEFHAFTLSIKVEVASSKWKDWFQLFLTDMWNSWCVNQQTWNLKTWILWFGGIHIF